MDDDCFSGWLGLLKGKEMEICPIIPAYLNFKAVAAAHVVLPPFWWGAPRHEQSVLCLYVY